MNNINKILITTEKTYKIYDENNNEIGKIIEIYNHKLEKYSYLSEKCLSYGHYIMKGIFKTEKTALKKLLEDTEGVYI